MILRWLHEPWPTRPPFRDPIPGLPAEPTRLQILAALIGMNGGEIVRGWGITENGGPYGRIGLERDEAIALIEFGAFVRGALLVEGEAAGAEVIAAIDAEIERVSALTGEAPSAPEGG